jgi:SAM-dependent methyltransferase
VSRGFNDHFGPVSSAYADFRPRYPASLYAWLASLVETRSLAWDCGAGSGQASLDLAAHFEQVIATDASPAQIEAATPHPRVAYRLAPAEASGLPDASVDLVTVAQALHWFDLEAFYAEVRRVLKPSGVLAVWSYGHLVVEGEPVNALVHAFYHETVGPYWPPERAHVEAGYLDLPFPFGEITPPEFDMTAAWPLPQLLGYFRSWSATARYIRQNGTDPVSELEGELAVRWGAGDEGHAGGVVRRVTWPLALRVGRPIANPA